MAKNKKKKGLEDLDESELPPWKSLNIGFNYKTCKKTRGLIQEQIDSFDPGFFSQVTKA
jgi:hypothetical protein